MLKSAGFRGEVKKKNLTLQPKLSGFLVKLSRFYALVGGLFVKFFMKNLTDSRPRNVGSGFPPPPGAATALCHFPDALALPEDSRSGVVQGAVWNGSRL